MPKYGRITLNDDGMAATYGGLLVDCGANVPSDGLAGYSQGCLFVLTGSAAGLYMNSGSDTSCDFGPV